MVEISPFKGLIYNKDKVDKLDMVMSPPYDIISKKMQDELYQKHPYNFVKLILGKQFPTDTEKDNRYTRAKRLFEEWQRQSILLESKRNAIYPYKIDYMINDESKTMNGFFALLKLDPEYKVVKAHERTLSKPKADRLNLIRACNANLEPIQLLYMDNNDVIRKLIDASITDPIIDVKAYDGFRHRLWKLEDEQVISQIKDELYNKVLFIADGHHRYQTAVDYAMEKTGFSKKDTPYNYRMVVLVNMFDKGLSILPTHRLIKIQDLNTEELLTRAREYFIVEEKTICDREQDYSSIGERIRGDIETEDEHRFALYCKDRYYILTLKDEGVMDEFAGKRSKTWRSLDVTILHKIILEHLLGINEKNIEDHILYTRDDEEAVRFVNEGRFNISFLMNPTRIEELKDVAEAGEHMPQKSTYFLPKMLSGLVMYKMQ